MEIKSQPEITPGEFTRPHAVDSTVLVAYGTAQIVISRGCFYAIGFLASMILARGLGPANYGVYGLVMSVLLWIEQTSRSTIAQAVVILIPRENQNRIALQRTAVFLNALLYIFLFVFLWISAPLLSELFNLDGGAHLFRLAALDLPFFGMYVVYRGLLQGHQDFLSISIAEVLYSVIKLVGVLFLVVLWFSIPAALIVNILASIAAMLFLLSRISWGTFLPTYTFIRPLIRLALPLGVYMIAHQGLGNLDLWCVNALTPGKDAIGVGLYVAARTVAFVPSFILIGVSDAILPSLSRAIGEDNGVVSQQYVQGAVRFLWMTALPITLLFQLTGSELMTFLYLPAYGEGSNYLSVLVWAALLWAFVALFASILTARGETYLCAAVLFLLIPVSVSFNTFLIPAYKIVGAAYSSVFTALIGTIVLACFVYHRFGSLIKLHTLLKTVFAALLMGAMASQFQPTGILLAISYLGYLAVYGLVLIALGEVRQDDLCFLVAPRV